MKNEPVVSYNHMQEDNSTNTEVRSHHSFNLYLLFAMDIILIAAIAFAALEIIF